jgi:hypothetical protein
MTATSEHYRGCHPEHEQGDQPANHQAQEVEPCWHCGTPTPHGCNCIECRNNAEYIPPAAVYHCPLCGRWWAWMTGLNITTLTFGAREGE